MNKVLVFMDAGFLSKLSKHFGKGQYLKYDIIKFAKQLAKKQGLFCEKIFYYNAPPFQSQNPLAEESKKYKNYRKFTYKLSQSKDIIIREGRCQRLKIDGKFEFKQKAVDTLMTIDLTSIPVRFKEIKKVILIASDSDFVPVIENLKQFNIKTVLYTYYEKARKAQFSTSNELIKSVYKYVKLIKLDFENAKLLK